MLRQLIASSTRDRAGRWTYYDYDQLKRPIRVQDPTGNTLEMKYDAGGNLTRLLDAKGNATRFSYDAIGRLQTKTYADNTFVSWNYDALGRMDAQRDAQGKVTRYLYDADDRLRKIDYPTSADVTVNYDAQDRPNSVTDAIGTTRVTYDELDRVKAVDGPWDSDTVSYEYDAVGRRKTLRVNGVAGVGSEDASYVYDTLGRLQKLTGMAGEFNYSYVGETGALSQLQLPNGTKTVYGYDNLERLTSLTNQKNTGELLSRYAYGYEETHAGGNYALRGLRTSMDSQLSDIATGAAQQAQRTLYAYSGDSQLTGESTTPIAGQGQNTASSWSRGYGYDAMGNRTSATQTNEDGVISNSSSTANKLNQLTAYSTNTTTGTTSNALASALIYDARGNLSEQATKINDVDSGKARYVYDDLNRLVSLTSLSAAGTPQSQTRFVYDSASRKRIQATFNWQSGAWQQTSEKRYVYNGMEVVQERDENNAVTASNLWSGGVGGLLARRTQNATLFPSYDGGGNVTGLTDGAGARVAKYRYDAFGNTLEASGPQAANNPYRFSTKEAVAGLYDYGYRFYSPGLGRWINRDPILEQGGFNLYNFVSNSPTNAIDEDGNIAFLVVLIPLAAPMLVGGLTNVAMGYGMARLFNECYSREDMAKDFLIGVVTEGGIGLAAKGLSAMTKSSKLFFHGASEFDAALIENGARHWATPIKELSEKALEIGGRKRWRWPFPRLPYRELKDLSKVSELPAHIAAKYERYGPNLLTWRKGWAGEHFYQGFGWRHAFLQGTAGLQSVGFLRALYEGSRAIFSPPSEDY